MIILLRKKSVKWLAALLAIILILTAVKGKYDSRTTEDVEPTAVVMAEAAAGDWSAPDADAPKESAPDVAEDTDAAEEAQEPAAAAPEEATEEQSAIALRMERSQNRAQETAQLTEIIANGQISDATRTEAEAKLLRLNEQSALELQAETMLKTKGYDQAVVMVDFQQATVYITSELAAEDFDKIGDLVQSATNFSLEQIIIIPK